MGQTTRPIYLQGSERERYASSEIRCKRGLSNRLHIGYSVNVIQMPTFSMVQFVVALALCAGLAGGVLLVGTVEAGMTRVAIMLSGEGCTAQRQALIDAVSTVRGVVSVDGRTIPDHLLVDVAHEEVIAEQLVRTVNSAISSASCKAEEMKSCISADLPR